LPLSPWRPASSPASGVSALRVGAVLLTLVVFLGANVAWLLLFDQTQSHALA
jgi:hypothetical protein